MTRTDHPPISQVGARVAVSMRRALDDHRHAVARLRRWHRLDNSIIGRLPLAGLVTARLLGDAWGRAWSAWGDVLKVALILRCSGRRHAADWLISEARVDAAEAWPGRAVRLPCDGERIAMAEEEE